MQKIQNKIPVISWGLLLAFLSIAFFTPAGFHGILLLAFSLAVYFLVVLRLKSHALPHVPKTVIATIIDLCLSLLLIVLFSPYSFENAGKLVLCGLTGIALVFFLEMKHEPRISSIFYLLLSFALTAACLAYAIDPSIYQGFGGTPRGELDLAPMVFGLPDKNRTALLVFLYLGVSLKRKNPYGVILSTLYPFLYLGRQYLLMCVALAVFYVLLRIIEHLKAKAIKISSPVFILSMFLTSAIVMAFFSWVWVAHIIPMGVSEYKTSLNDESSASRFISTTYVLEQTRDCFPEILIFGYDENFFDEFGINMGGLDKLSKDQTTFINDTYRLVQPHEDVINTFVKEGFLFTLFYYAAIALILAQLNRENFNIAYNAAYFIGALFLHNMYAGGMFFGLMYVLCQESMPFRNSQGTTPALQQHHGKHAKINDAV